MGPMPFKTCEKMPGVRIIAMISVTDTSRNKPLTNKNVKPFMNVNVNHYKFFI